MITNLAAAAADCGAVTWPDVAVVAILATAFVGWIWIVNR